MFQVPSTPDSRRGDTTDIPSTTPAGPPPTGFTHQSFTPAGQPPPSSVFGSSFGPSNGATSKPFSFSNFAKSPSNRPMAISNRIPSKGFTVPNSSPPHRSGDVSLDELGNTHNGNGKGPIGGAFGAMKAADEPIDSMEDMLDFQDSPRGAKRSRNGDVMASSMRVSRMLGRDSDREATMPSAADGLAAGMPIPTAIAETDDLVLNTESTLVSLDEASKSKSEAELETSVQQAVQSLLQTWSKHSNPESIPASIGPVDRSPSTRASYIASLLLQIHHPTTLSPTATRATAFSLLPRSSTVPLPQSLLSWLNRNHNPFPDDLAEVQSARPSSTAHDRFWDTIFQTLLRGNIATVINLLSTANWTHADTALEDGYPTPGYSGAQLAAVQHVVGACVALLRTCPAVTDGDWAVTGTDWQLFRTRTRRTLGDLEEYAEADSADRQYGDVNLFAASAVGQGGSFAAGARRAESRVPWTVYEQLKAVYGQLLGFREEILLSAQDWLEAVVYLAVWWDGEEEGVGSGRRSGYGRRGQRLVDLEPGLAYRRRMLDAFASVTDSPEDAVLGVNAVEPVQVAVGAVFEGEVEAVLKILLRLSPLVAAAVVDVASVGGWMPEGRPRTGDVMDGFDQEDLMVLSHGQLHNGQKKTLDRDTVLTTYADLLSKKDNFRSSSDFTAYPGWELAVRVLSRLDSPSTAQQKISDVFASMSLSSSAEVDKALSVCTALGLDDQVRAISARYADSLASTTHSYGAALLYYARAHDEDKLQSTLDLLLSTSLVRSAAYPQSAELDVQLDELLGNQMVVLARLARQDVVAARMLARRLSGYATLRKFYDLRDEDEADGEDEVPGMSRRSGLRPVARKKEMVKAVTALVDSAGESIRGGLYDGEAKGVVQVDALLALLGESLPLLNHSTSLFSKRQLMALLRATEDLQTVSSRVYEQVEALFQASMTDFHSGGLTKPEDLARSLLAKSTSNLSGMSGSTYGMVNSRGSIESEKTNGSAGGQAQGGVDDGRGWDWRRGVALTMGKSAKGEDVLRLLRVGIAKEIGKGWAEGR